MENAYGPLVVAALIALTGTTAQAQPPTPRGVARAEFSSAAIHGRIIRGSADDGFTGADVGMELRGCPRSCRVVPWIAVALGGIHDRLGAAPMARLSLGLDVRLSANYQLRGGLLRSAHGKGSSGPNGLIAGLSCRIG